MILFAIFHVLIAVVILTIGVSTTEPEELNLPGAVAVALIWPVSLPLTAVSAMLAKREQA